MSETIVARIEAVQTQLTAVHTELRALAELVDTLDPDALDATAEDAARSVIDWLASAGLALNNADEPLAAAAHHAHRLP